MSIATILAFIFSLVIQVGYPLAVVLFFRRRTRAPWQLFVYGALVFALFQLFTWLPLSVYLDTVIAPYLDTEWEAFLWLMALAFSTSLIEELGRLWGFRYLFPRGGFKLTWRNGVMFGLGHGTLETVLLIAGLTFVYFLAYLVLNWLGSNAVIESWGADISPALEETLRALVNTSWAQPLIVALERILALPHQVAWTLLVMESQVCREKRWFGFAVLYHFSVAVIVPGLARLFGFVPAEIANMALTALSIWIILRLRAISATLQSVPRRP